MKRPKRSSDESSSFDAADRALARYDDVARVASTCRPGTCLDALDALVDVDEYLRLLALMTMVRSGDYVDEVWFYASEELVGARWRFRAHAWDPTTRFRRVITTARTRSRTRTGYCIAPRADSMSRSCATRRCTPRSWTRSSGRFARVCARRRSTPSPRRNSRRCSRCSPTTTPPRTRRARRPQTGKRNRGERQGGHSRKHAMVPLAHARASQTVTATRRRVPIRASRSTSRRDSRANGTETRRRRRRERGRFRRVRVRVLVEDVPRRIEGCVSDVRSRARLGVRRGRDGERHAPRTRVRRRRRARINRERFSSSKRRRGNGVPGRRTGAHDDAAILTDGGVRRTRVRRVARDVPRRVLETRGTPAKIGTPRKPKRVGSKRRESARSRPNDRARRERERERRRRRGRVERDGARRFS